MSTSESCPESVRADLLSAARMTVVANGRLFVDRVAIDAPFAFEAHDAQVLPSLASALYSRWFAGWWPPVSTEENADSPGVIAAVRAAHSATGQFETNWIARAVDGYGGVVAVRADEELLVYPPDYVNITRLAAPVRVGDSLAVTKRRDTQEPQDGWWMTWGREGPAPEKSMIRLYWNSSVDGAAAIVKAITAVLEALHLPYTLKCPSEPGLFGRRDALVLYLAPDVWNVAKTGLRRACENTASCVQPQTPPLTLRLAPGVALAEDPGDGTSFGQSRASAVAEGVLEVIASGAVSTEDTIAILAARLKSNRISPVRPYLSLDGPLDRLSGW